MYKIKILAQLNNSSIPDFPNDLDITTKAGRLPTVAAYLFTTEKSTGTTYFGHVRKLYCGGRNSIGKSQITCGKKSVDINMTQPNLGAAGTRRKYHGKWTSIGGTQLGKTHESNNLAGVIKELNDEIGLKKPPLFYNWQTDIDISPKPINVKLNCHLYHNFNKQVAIFLFEVIDNNDFFTMFPKDGRLCYNTTLDCYKNSQEELDAAQAYSLEKMVELQNNEVKTKNNNYFIDYFLKNFINIIVPKMMHINSSFKKKWFPSIGFQYGFKLVKDSVDRKISELWHGPY